MVQNGEEAFFSVLSKVFGQNLYRETDTLTRGKYSVALVPYFWDNTTAFDSNGSIRIDRNKKHHPFWDKNKRWEKRLSIANTPELELKGPYTFSFCATDGSKGITKSLFDDIRFRKIFDRKSLI